MADGMTPYEGESILTRGQIKKAIRDARVYTQKIAESIADNLPTPTDRLKLISRIRGVAKGDQEALSWLRLHATDGALRMIARLARIGIGQVNIEIEQRLMLDVEKEEQE